MPVHYSTASGRVRTQPAFGANRKKKYLKIFHLLLLAAAVVTVYMTVQSGILIDNNPQIREEFVYRTNVERQANALSPVIWDENLAGSATGMSREVKLSHTASDRSKSSTTDSGQGIFIVPKLSWALSGLGSRYQLFDEFENNNPSFRNDILNKKFSAIGIGITSGAYNYYIVTRLG